VWPSAKLAKGLAAASPPLAASLGRPAAGSKLAIYTCPNSSSSSSSGGTISGGVISGVECGAVWLRVCRDRADPELLAVEGEGRQQRGVGAATAVAGSPVTPRCVGCVCVC